MSITGEPQGDPQKVGIAITDIGAGMWSAFAIMAAVFHRDQHGEGQYIDVSMMDAQVSWLTYQAAFYFANGQPPGRTGGCPPYSGAIPGVHVQGWQVSQRGCGL